MTDYKASPNTAKFVEYSDFLLAKLNCKKGELAENLGITQDYFSKMYKGIRPVSTTILEKFRQVSQEQNSPKMDNPAKNAVQENLPLNPNISREDFAAQRALQGQDHEEIMRLTKQVAALEERLKQTKDDSEKKNQRAYCRGS